MRARYRGDVVDRYHESGRQNFSDDRSGNSQRERKSARSRCLFVKKSLLISMVYAVPPLVWEWRCAGSHFVTKALALRSDRPPHPISAVPCPTPKGRGTWDSADVQAYSPSCRARGTSFSCFPTGAV